MHVRLLSISILVLILCTPWKVNAQDHHKSEDEHHPVMMHHQSVTFGLGLPYSFELESPGINSRLYYNIGEKLCFGPEFSMFSNDEVDLIDFDAVVHYIFETPITGIYPVVGINYTIESEDSELHGTTEEEAWGVLFGLGVHRNFKKWTCFLEYTRVESDLHDQFSTIGLMYTFK